MEVQAQCHIFYLLRDNLEIQIMLNFLIFKYTQIIQIKNTKQHTIWSMSCQFWNLCIKSKLAGISADEMGVLPSPFTAIFLTC